MTKREVFEMLVSDGMEEKYAMEIAEIEGV